HGPTKSSIVFLLRGSMEPAFYRGDLLFLTNPPNQRYQTGDITVYKVPKVAILIVRRVLETHDLVISNSTKSMKDPFALCIHPTLIPQIKGSRSIPQDPINFFLLLTKGDNNYGDDIDLYHGLDFLERCHIVGKVQGFIPYIGYITIANMLKYAMLGGPGLLALLQRE
ncbi:hypothetical protein ID866_13314, partial [Astraeus odoratus]